LRALLDNHHDIRRTYAAWITAGDVLSELLQYLGAERHRILDTMCEFAQKEMLADQYANLQQAGHASDDRVPLTQVFVDLPASPHSPGGEACSRQSSNFFLKHLLGRAGLRLAADGAALGPEEIFGRHNRTLGKLVLIGGPGQGKSTIGQFACQLFRARVLRGVARLSPDAESVLAMIAEMSESSGLPATVAGRFPFRIVLNNFAAELSADNGEVRGVLDFVRKRIRLRTGVTMSADELRAFLRLHPAFFVFDGLDEVPPSSNRSATLAAIRDFWVEVTRENADVLVLATSRPQGYTDDFSPKQYEHHFLMPLDPAEAMDYGARLAMARYLDDEDRRTKVIDRLERATKQPTVARLMTTPLQVTIMTMLVDKIGPPPQDRWNLFKSYYEVIYDREAERDTPLATLLRTHRAAIDAIHTRTAILLQVLSEHSGGTDACVPQSVFRQVVGAYLREEGFSETEAPVLTAQIVECAMDRLVLLVGAQHDAIGYEIRSLQEFMAAQFVMSASDEHVRDRLRTLAPLAHWRNVYLFAAGRCITQQPHLKDTLHAISVQMNSDQADILGRHSLAGSMLALDLLADNTGRTHPNIRQAIASEALHLLALPPGEEHRRLAAAADTDLADLYQTEIRRHLNLDPAAARLASLTLLFGLDASPLSLASDLRVRIDSVSIDEAIGLTTGEPLQGLPFSRLNSVLRQRVSDTTPHQWLQLPRWPHRINDFAEEPDLAPAEEWRAAIVETFLTSFRWRKQNMRTAQVNFTRSMSFTLVSVDAELSELALLADIPDNVETWNVPRSVGRFALGPTHGALADLLASIHTKEDCQVASYLSRFLPWPAAACVRSIAEGDDAHTMESACRSGILGTLTEWRRAEERFLRVGLTIDDYVTAANWPLPLSREIAEHGVPTTVWLLSKGSDPDVSALIEVLKAIPKGPRWTSVISDLLSSITFALETEHPRVSHRITDSEKVTIAAVLADMPYANGRDHLNHFVPYLNAADFTSETWRPFFERGDRTFPLYPLFRFPQSSTGLAGEWRRLNRPDYLVGVLAVQGFAAPQVQDVAALLTIGADDRWVVPATLILARSRARPNDTQVFIRDAVLAGRLDEWGVLQVIDSLVGQGKEALMSELFSRLEWGQWRPRRALVEGMRAVIGRRVSPLTDPGVAASLGFSASLAQMIGDSVAAGDRA
jgi:hypothetical protein